MEKKVLLIIPCYNEEEGIKKTVDGIVEYNKKNHTFYDYVVINDGSTDNSEYVLLKNKIKHIRLIKNLGIGGAVQTGYKFAYANGYDIAVQFDGDGQHDIRYVEKLIAPIINDHANCVIGSRFIDSKSSKFKSTGARRFGIKIISFFIKIFAGKKITDPTSGFRSVDKDIIEMFASDYPTEYPEPISEVTIVKRKKKVMEVPVNMNERTTGVSSIHAWKNVYYMINVILSIFVVSIRRYK